MSSRSVNFLNASSICCVGVSSVCGALRVSFFTVTRREQEEKLVHFDYYASSVTYLDPQRNSLVPTMADCHQPPLTESPLLCPRPQ